LQPFERFRPVFIPKLVELEKFYLVSQTYTRYKDNSEAPPKRSLLLTDYADEVMAKTHLQALRNDKYAAILNLQRPAHKSKLLELLGEQSAFHVFWAVVKNTRELEEKINAVFKPNMKNFIDRNTNWRISRDTTLRPAIELIFGELYITLTHEKQAIRVKFEDIETA
ncbi:MAG TPA: hypothetical protein VLD19_01620, partial [Chitinophagaceae bacterium]|nr:hypothetical protein [Chitinophagaceae bacterium]